jgi:hypothetical protein
MIGATLFVSSLNWKNHEAKSCVPLLSLLPFYPLWHSKGRTRAPPRT